jgi:hypothetical protein
MVGHDVGACRKASNSCRGCAGSGGRARETIIERSAISRRIEVAGRAEAAHSAPERR